MSQSNSHYFPSVDFLLKSAIIVILWATPPLVSKIWVGNESVFPGLFFGFLRYLLGFLTLIILLIYRGKIRSLIELGLSKSKELIFCSFWLVLMIVGQNFSVKFILGASSSILLNFNPVIVYMIAPLMFIDEEYTSRKTFAVFLSTFGIVLVFFAAEDLLTTDPGAFIVGNLLGLLAGIAWAGYSLSLKKLFLNESSEEITTINLLLASLMLLLFSLLLEELPPLSDYSFESALGLIIIGVGAAAIAFTLYLQLIQTYGAIQAANIQFLIPLVSIFIAWIFLSEFSPLALFGG
ncbi:MAG: DMT family transporter, partial [Candidatus Hodarchaeales archaeon]